MHTLSYGSTLIVTTASAVTAAWTAYSLHKSLCALSLLLSTWPVLQWGTARFLTSLSQHLRRQDKLKLSGYKIEQFLTGGID